MKRMMLTSLLWLFCALLMGCNGQNQKKQPGSVNKSNRVGGECEEGYCELMYLGMPKNIPAVDTSAGWYEKGQKLVVTGTVLQIDGKTPAANVIVYYHQTDNDGYYSSRNDKPENQTRHGHIRGWVKTGADGKYAIHTIRPAPYPGEQIPAHIHLMIKEPCIQNEYWIDDLVFDDDPLLIPHRKKYPETAPRGGSGTLRILLNDRLQVAEHNIILGLNIPNYPKKVADAKQSGLNIGESQPSFGPMHAYGPDKGSTACPVCKYGRYHGILYFVGNRPNWNEIKQWLRFLEAESIKRQKFLKVYFIYGNEKSYSKTEREKALTQMGNELGITYMALTFVPSFNDTKTEANLNKLNPAVENTFIVYRQRNIIDKYIDLKPTSENFRRIIETLDKTKSSYFHLAEPLHD
ncbi:MAG: intradiol ring-cleavage dioxygenase [Bacteroidota bacterium]